MFLVPAFFRRRAIPRLIGFCLHLPMMGGRRAVSRLADPYTSQSTAVHCRTLHIPHITLIAVNNVHTVYFPLKRRFPLLLFQKCNEFTAARKTSYSASQVHLSWRKNNCELNLSGDVFHQNSTALSHRSISLMSLNIKSAPATSKTLFLDPGQT